MPEQHLPLIITTTNTNSNTNNNNTYYSPGDILPQRTYSRSTSASPPPSPTARRKRTMSSSTSSSASASPILEPRSLSITSPSAAAAASTPHPRPRKATCTSQSHLPEAIPEHHVPEFKLQSSSAGAAAYEQDPLQIKAHLTELLNCEQVRNDPIMRQYVQSRLFESELELSMFALFFFFFSFLPFFGFKMLTWMNRASTTKKT